MEVTEDRIAALAREVIERRSRDESFGIDDGDGRAVSFPVLHLA